jgi:hypothetical protein
MLLKRKVPPNFFCIFFSFIISFYILIATDFSVIINSKQGVPTEANKEYRQTPVQHSRLSESQDPPSFTRGPGPPPPAHSPPRFSSGAASCRAFSTPQSPPLGACFIMAQWSIYAPATHPPGVRPQAAKTKGSLSGCSLLARPHPGPYASRMTSAMAQHTIEAEECRA